MQLALSRYLSSSRQAFSPAEEHGLFNNLRTSNGTLKQTAHRRLADVDDLFFDVAAGLGVVPSTVMDVGCSVGMTTAEWLQAFERHGMPVAMLATDLTMWVYIAELWPGVRAVLEPNGHILQIELLGRGLRPWCAPREYWSGGFIWRNMLVSLVRRRAARRADLLRGPVPLVCAALQRESVALFDDDILKPNPPQ